MYAYALWGIPSWSMIYVLYTYIWRTGRQSRYLDTNPMRSALLCICRVKPNWQGAHTWRDCPRRLGRGDDWVRSCCVDSFTLGTTWFLRICDTAKESVSGRPISLVDTLRLYLLFIWSKVVHLVAIALTSVTTMSPILRAYSALNDLQCTLSSSLCVPRFN